MELTVPALLLAGLGASPHCALMCGPMQILQLRRRTAPAALLWLHLGRLSGYGLLGALAGGFGSLWLARLPFAAATWVPLGTSAGVILLGLRGLQRQRRHAGGCPPITAGPAPQAWALWRRGLVWALLPCGLLYGLLFLALLSGSAGRGAALLLCFGLGGLPLLLGSAWFAQRLGRWLPHPRWSAALLIALGLGTALTALGHHDEPSPWCQPTRQAALRQPGGQTL